MTELPRVGIISSTPYAPPWSEGVRNLIRSYARAFTARGLAVTVVGPLSAEAIAQGDHGEQVVNGPLSFSRVGALRKAGLWFETAKAARELKSEVDVFLMIASATSSLGFRTRLLKRAVSKPIALYVTGLGYPRLGCRWGLACERVYVGNEFLRKWFPSA